MGCFASSYVPVKAEKREPVVVLESNVIESVAPSVPIAPGSLTSAPPPVSCYAISQNRWISLVQSILTDVFVTTTVQDMEKDIGMDIDAFYHRLIAGKTRLTGKVLTVPELYVYAGIVGLCYGPTSHKFEHMTKNFVQYATLDMTEFKQKLTVMHGQCTKPITYATSFDKNDITVLDDDVSLLLLANFATGTKRSQVVLDEAKKIVPDVSMLVVAGDTFYSGTVAEQEQHLIQPIRSVFPHVLIRYLRGSHDMYSGPDGFEYIKKTLGQSASYFSIRNRYFLLQGLDTSYRNFMEKTAMVREDELEWHTQCVHEATQQKKKIMLLSYHEPFSYDQHMTTLMDQLTPLLPASDAYFFGQQRQLMLYEDYKHDDVLIKKPRLIGHSGASYMNVNHVMEYSHVLPGEEWHLRHNGDVMDSGFCVVRCKAGHVTVEYYTIHFIQNEHESAVCVYQETL